MYKENNNLIILALIVLCTLSMERITHAQNELVQDTNVNNNEYSRYHIERLFEGGFFLEGPAVAPDGKVYFSDITFTMDSGMEAGRIWCYDPETKNINVFRSPSGMANGILFDLAGNMIVAEGADYGGRRLTSTDMVTGKSKIIAGLFEGRPFNSPNDLAIDSLGRIYFTDPRYVGHEKIDQPVMGVYRLDPDGKISCIINSMDKPNGIAVSPDQRSLFVACFDDAENATDSTASICRAVYKYCLLQDGSVQDKRKIVDVYPAYGVDGITVDKRGNLYITSYPPAGISIYTNEGEKIGFIPIPENPSNVFWYQNGDQEILYVTAERSLYKVMLNSKAAN